MRTTVQAAAVAALTGEVHVAGKPRKDGTVALSRLVDVGADNPGSSVQLAGW